jgi:hypothetical protein
VQPTPLDSLRAAEGFFVGTYQHSFCDLSFPWIGALTLRVCVATYTTVRIAMPVLSPELLVTAIQLVCYFCTALGVAFAFVFGVRA